MAKDKDPNDPSTTSFEWDSMIETWSMIDTLLGGTKAMRAAGSLFLPPHSAETDFNYQERLMTNVLFNAMELTLDHFVGRPFSDPVRLNNDVPEDIVEHVRNVDLQGNDITSFCREWFREGVAKGFAHVMVDMPSLSMEELEFRTQADDIAEGRRPFWVMIKPENMIFAESQIFTDPVSGEPREMYTHVRLRENIIVREGFAQIVKERIRVLEPGFFQVFEKRKVRNRKPEWVVVESGMTGIDFIPIITYYSNRDSFLLSKPPLEDLAHLNIRHWQSTSDQINILTVVRFPMLAVAGATDSGGEMAIGPRQLLATKDPNGRFYYVEHKGESIAAGKEELESLEESMEAYGATFLKRQPGNETATGRALDSAEAISPLQDMTLRFIDLVNNALDLHAFWLNKPEGGTVTITTDFGPEEVTSEDAKLLIELRKGRDISRIAFIKEAQRRGIMSEEYDQEADFQQMLEEDRVLKPLQPQIPGTFDPSEKDGSEAPSTGVSDIDEPTPRSTEDE